MNTPNKPLRHTIPQLSVQDYIFSSGGIDISVRQFLFVVVAILIDINVWLVVTPSIELTFTTLVGWTLLAIPVVLALVFGWVTIQGQPLERRLLRMMRYYARPQVYVWQRPTTVIQEQATPVVIREKMKKAGRKRI